MRKRFYFLLLWVSAFGVQAQTQVSWDAFNIGTSTAYFEWFGGGIDALITVPPGGSYHISQTSVTLTGPVQSRWACSIAGLIGAPQNQHVVANADTQTALCGAPNTNCMVTFTLNNTSPYDQIFSLQKHGADTGNFFLIHGGQNTRVQYADPNCDPTGYSVRQLSYYARFSITNTVDIGTAGQMFQGSVTNPNYDGPAINFNGQQISSTDTNSTGTVVTAGNNSYPQVTNNPASSNAPVVFTNYPGTAPYTNPVTGGQFSSGVDALYDATVQGNKAIVDAIHQLDQDNQNDNKGISNAIKGLSFTNSGNGSNTVVVTNGLTTNDLENMGVFEQNLQSNKLANATTAMQAATNAAGSVGNGSLVAAASGIDSGFGASSGGGASSIDITLGGSGATVALSIGPPNYIPSALMHSLISWLCYLFLFIANYKVFRTGLNDALQAPQAVTAGEEVLGNNINFASALVVAGLIVATVGTVPALFLPQLITALAHVMGTPFGALSSMTAYGWATQACPFDVMLSVIGSHLLFRMLVDGMVAVVCAIVRFLVGL